MLRIFKRIRKVLFKKKKLKQYFGYAIGESLLIILSIFLALKVDDWSNNIELRKKEKELLRQVWIDLNSSVYAIEEANKIHRRAIKSHENIFTILITKITTWIVCLLILILL